MIISLTTVIDKVNASKEFLKSHKMPVGTHFFPILIETHLFQAFFNTLKLKKTLAVLRIAMEATSQICIYFFIYK